MRNKSRLVFLLAVVLTALSFAGLGAVEAQDPLLQKARMEGSVRVIVQLRSQAQPVGDLGGFASPAAQAQTADLTALRRGLAAQLISTGADVKISGTSDTWTIPFVAMQVDEAGLRGLRANPNVVGVVEDELSALHMQQSVNVVRAPEAWNIVGATGSGWAVAVLDTGVLSTHEFLTGKVIAAAEACFSNASGTGIGQTYCPNLSGTQTGAGAANPARCRSLGPVFDACSHGTHVAGTIAGSLPANNLYGVARDASIIAVQVFTHFTAPNCGSYTGCALSYTSDQISGLEYVLSLTSTYNIAAVNMSLGGGFYNNQTTCDNQNASRKAAIDNLRSVGVATVISSGNDGFTNGMGAPGCISSAIAVGASDDSDVVAGFSNSHAMLDLYAPGVDIFSATSSSNTAYENYNGTSMAAPHVAGAWAVMKQAYSLYWGGSISVDQVLRALQSGRMIGKAGVTRPRIDVGRAARLLTGFVAPSAASLTPQPWQFFGSNALLTWTYNDRAFGYEVVVDNNSNFSSPEYSAVVGNSVLDDPNYPSILTGPLADGVYFWRVRAQLTRTPTITYGPWSAVGRFTVDRFLKQFR